MHGYGSTSEDLVANQRCGHVGLSYGEQVTAATSPAFGVVLRAHQPMRVRHCAVAQVECSQLFRHRRSALVPVQPAWRLNATPLQGSAVCDGEFNGGVSAMRTKVNFGDCDDGRTEMVSEALGWRAIGIQNAVTGGACADVQPEG